jgi:hypothetical protein
MPSAMRPGLTPSTSIERKRGASKPEELAMHVHTVGLCRMCTACGHS